MILPPIVKLMMRRIILIICRRRKQFVCLILLAFCWLLGSKLFSAIIGLDDRGDQLVGTFSNDNYLTAYKSPSFLVNNRKCRIPQIQLWNEQVLSMVNKEKINGCDDNSSYKNYFMRSLHPNIKNLVTVENQTLILNEDALKPLELTLKDIECCYQIVERVEQDKDYYNKDADNTFKYSEKCYTMGQQTNPHEGFVKITCHRKNVLLSRRTRIHVDFHLVAIFPSADNPTSFGKKLAYWKERNDEHFALNLTSILLIGLDSMSRLNFHRMMPSTRNVLEKELNAVEMNGYTKVAKNTFPNVVSMLTSHSQNELGMFCHDLWETPLDDCHFIWKNFSAMNYLTALIDDNPKISIFNHGKLGFLKKPMDIYVRPWMLAAYQENKDNGCIGRRRTDHVTINYMKDLAVLAASKGVPYFVTVWLSDRNHDLMSEPKYMDDSMGEALITLKSTGSLDNTLVILLGDHGYSFLEIRRTLSGWYEDKLPVLWISLPPSLVKTKPSWKLALNRNSKQLTTPFNVHDTLGDILNYNLQLPIKPTNDSQGLSRKGSLFKTLPERSCDEAGVPWEFCACSTPIQYKGNHTVILKAAHNVVQQINWGLISNFCKRITDFKVSAIAVVPKFPLSPPKVNRYHLMASLQEADLFQGNSYLVIGFELFNGRFHLESFLEYDKASNRFYTVNRLQTNVKRDCRVAPRVEYCWCKMLLFL